MFASLAKVDVKDSYDDEDNDSDDENTTVKVLTKGQSFGEVALRTEGIRTSTATCNTQYTQLLVLSASSYKKVLNEYHDWLYNEKINFLRGLTLFKNWTSSSLH